nr:integrase [Pseudoalteromonas sp. Isolate3]
MDIGADLRKNQEILGHASILTTQLYTHVSSKNLFDVYEANHTSAEGGRGLFKDINISNQTLKNTRHLSK